MNVPTCPVERACAALWSANLAALAQQDSFSPASRASFARLHERWTGSAHRLAQPAPREGRGGLLQQLAALAPRRL